MFEKEAEERLPKAEIDYCNSFQCKPNEVPVNEIVRFESGYKKGFKDGAEFGYNKANEWHYVKDGVLPNTQFGRVDVTVAYINAYENPCKKDCCFDGTNFVYWDDRKPVGWKKVDIFGKIYAWKYPEKLPELKESE